MTVSATGNRFIYAGDGASTAFPFPRPFITAQDLRVVLVAPDDSETVQTPGLEYTVATGLDQIAGAWADATAYQADDVVSHAGGYYLALSDHTSGTSTEPGAGAGWQAVWLAVPVADGGEVIMASPPASGARLLVTRRTALTQETAYQAGGAFSAQGHEAALDKLTLQVQDHDEQIGRAIRLKESTEAPTPAFPEPEAGRLIGWNTGGGGLVNVAPTAISAGTITNTELADMAEATLKGRGSGGGTGEPQDLSAAEARALLNVEDGATAQPGIDDQTTGVVMTLTDGTLTLGAQTVVQDIDTAQFFLSGGDATNSGGNMVLRGGSNADAGDLLFREGANVKLHYDHSQAEWNFQGVNIDHTGIIYSRPGDATTLKSFFEARPTDYGTGKPRLAITKLVSPANWEIGLWDGSNNAGLIQLSADLINVVEGLRVGSDIQMGLGGPRIISGSGSPEGSVTAEAGSTYMRTDGGTATSLYVKESGSGNTGWIAAGNGAVTLNVLASGATGNGTTDDTAAIQAAIDAANAAGGGVVFLPEGTFLVSDTDADGYALELKTGVTLMGAGRGVSIIKLAANDNDTTVIKLNPSQTDITIRSVTVDGNRDNQGTPTSFLKGIAGSANLKRIRLDDVEVRDVYGRSVETNADGNLNDALGDEAEDIVITGCLVRNGGQRGVHVRRSKYVTVSNCVVDGKAVVDGNPDSAFEASRSQYVTFTGNTARNQTAEQGASYRVVSDSHYITFVGNVAEGGRLGMLCIDSTDVVFDANVLKDTLDGCLIFHEDSGANGWGPTERVTVCNNQLTNPDNDGIVVVVGSGANGTACTDIVLSNNILYDDGSSVMDYGIRLVPDAGTIGCREYGNTIVNAQVADKSGTFQSVDFGAITCTGQFTQTGSGFQVGQIESTDGGASWEVVGAAGAVRFFKFKTDSSPRWTLVANAAPESGANVGSDFEIQRYSDAGAFTETALKISRDSGRVEIKKDLRLNSDLEMSSGGPKVTAGSGSPEGAISAGVGSIYMRTDGSAGTCLYIKESGSGNTGWVAK